MEEVIDYQAVCEQLQRELEDARIALLHLRQAKAFHIDTASIKQFLTKNYVVISAACLLLFVLFSFIDTVKGFFTKDTKE